MMMRTSGPDQNSPRAAGAGQPGEHVDALQASSARTVCHRLDGGGDQALRKANHVMATIRIAQGERLQRSDAVWSYTLPVSSTTTLTATMLESALWEKPSPGQLDAYRSVRGGLFQVLRHSIPSHVQYVVA
jgi:hypothetical protein